MSYQVIARKWRPRNFQELVGQNHITQTLVNAIRGNRLPHALLFTGPRGTGKTSTARIFAKILRCSHRQGDLPCQECADCQDISSGRSIDVIEIDGASNNGVEAIRELRETVGYRPASGSHKLYIIDEVHMLSTSAFNALLKTLEEPPAHVLFIMATTEVHKIPHTILSRCQRFDFRRISLREIKEQLQKICDAEGVQYDAESLWMLARQGDGSLRDSQSLLDQVITYCESSLTQERVMEVLGLTDRSLLLGALKAFVKQDVRDVVGVLEKIFVSGCDPFLFMQDLLEEIRNLLLLRIPSSGASLLVDIADSESESLKEMGKELSDEDIHLLFDMALKGSNDVAKASNSKIVLEMVLLRMVSAPRVVDLFKLLTVSEDSSPSSSSSSSSSPPSQSSPSQSSPSSRTNKGTNVPQRTSAQRTSPAKKEEEEEEEEKVSVEAVERKGFDPSLSLEKNWSSFVISIRRETPILAAKLENVSLLERSGNSLILGVPEKLRFLHDKFKEASLVEEVVGWLKQRWGEVFSVEFKICVAMEGVVTPKEYVQRQKEDQQRELLRKIDEHPLVQATKKVFVTEEIQLSRDCGIEGGV